MESAPSPSEADRLATQLAFILELDRAKQVLRRSYLADGSRRENDAEHMWHAAVAAAVLSGHSGEPVDAARTVKLLLFHDVVEIDAGDTFVYDEVGLAGKEEREQAAATRLFGMLPEDQRDELVDLWEEFEAAQTPEARFARAIDRLMPLLLNRSSGGRSWRENGITAEQVRAVNGVIAEASPLLWAAADAVISDAEMLGWLPPGQPAPPAA
ncbi:MAG: HD domain-containing protein [Acidimicrobiales bacterium]